MGLLEVPRTRKRVSRCRYKPKPMLIQHIGQYLTQPVKIIPCLFYRSANAGSNFDLAL